jgi:hypothetical protein
MRKTKLVDVRQSKAKIALSNRSENYKQPLQKTAKNFLIEKARWHRDITSELEIDIALSCLNVCRYMLVWIIWLCFYASR